MPDRIATGDVGEARYFATVTRDVARRVWFHRSCSGLLTGGDVKHSHYFDHVLRMPGFGPRITFSGEPSSGSLVRERRRLWPAGDRPAPRWEPGPRDLLFIAEVDWRYLAERRLEALPNPRIKMIQHVQHADAATERYDYLSEKAVRICVSREGADVISATGRTRGPVLPIPNGIDLSPFEPAEGGSPVGYEKRRQPLVNIGYKRPDLAWSLSDGLDAESIPHLLIVKPLDRRAFLALLTETRVAVCLPHSTEGFYLPALEAMASGALVVTLDRVGNRGFCHHDRNCFIAKPCAGSLLDMTKRALVEPALQRGHLHRRARGTALRHSLEAERARFHAILKDIDRIWRTG